MDGSPRAKSAPPRWPLGLASWVALLLLYGILAGSPSGPELAAGAAASLLATVSAFAAGSPEHLGRMPRGWWWLLVRRVGPRLIPETFRVLHASIGSKGPAGRFRTVEFRAGGDDTFAGTRRALVLFGASMAPNGYVVQLDGERDVLVSHELVPQETPPGSGDPLWPI